MNGGYVQALLFLLNRPEPIRQASLLMVLASGMGDSSTLLDGLQTLANESAPPWSGKVNQLRILLEQGQSLSDALTTARGLVPNETMIAIRMAEDNGVLKQVLADEAHRMMNSSATVTGATIPSLMIWLLAVVVSMVFILGFIMMFIIPKFMMIFEDFDTDMPAITEMLIGVSSGYAYVLLFPISLTAFATVMFVRSSLRQLSTGHMLLSHHFPRYWTPIVLRTLSLSVTTKTSLEGGLHCLLKDMQPGRAARLLSSSRVSTAAGYDCWESLRKTGFLKQREVTFLKHAERTNHLDWGLRHLSRTISRRRGDFLQRLINMVQPTVILAIGLVVMFVTAGLFVPLVKLLNDLS